MAGYMVKPLRPLVCLLLLWLAGTAVRYVTSVRQTADGRPALEPLAVSGGRASLRSGDGELGGEASSLAASRTPPLTVADNLGVALGEAGRAIIRPTPKLPPGSNLLTWPSIGRLAESLVSKILLVILVISISNTSSALDRIIEAVLP
jgi:hypothetical protein